jgi:hypothetical protein
LRSTTKTLAVTASALLVFLLSGVAAGASQSSSPKKWVSVFCGSVLTWEHTVKSNSASLSNAISGLSTGGKVDLHAARAKLVGFLDGLVKSTNTMIGNVKATGAPDVKNGSKIQKGVLDALGQIAKAFNDGKKSAQQLPTSNAKSFSKAAVALGETIQSSTNRIGAAFGALSKYSSKPLDDAAKKTPACTKLGG